MYTSTQAVQLIRASIGDFKYSGEYWNDLSGFYDPIRPVVASRFESSDLMLSSRGVMLQNLRRILELSDVFIFTLGLTESWIRRSDSAVLPTAPGVIAGKYDAQKFYFKNESYDLVVDNLHVIYGLLKSLNKDIKIIITVSPIPLAATALPRHVAVSSAASKSILRAASEAFCNLSDVDYFPSFEMFYTPGMCDGVFRSDARHASSFGINRVMRAFHTSYWWPSSEFTAGAVSDVARTQSGNNFVNEVNRSAGRAVCDEDSL